MLLPNSIQIHNWPAAKKIVRYISFLRAHGTSRHSSFTEGTTIKNIPFLMLRHPYMKQFSKDNYMQSNYINAGRMHQPHLHL